MCVGHMKWSIKQKYIMRGKPYFYGYKWHVALILLPRFKAFDLNSLKEFGCCSLTFRAHRLLWKNSTEPGGKVILILLHSNPS